MAEPLSNYQELEKEQMKKIQYFCHKIGDNNLERAERYLNHANWNEDIAVRIFIQKHPNYFPNQQNNVIQDFQNQQPFQPQLPPPSQISNRNKPQLPNNEKKEKENILEFLIGDAFINNKYKNQLNSDHINYLKENLKCVEINFGFFLRSLKEKPGIIIVFKGDRFNILKEQIKKLNENQEIINKCIIFPVLNNFPIGNEFCQKLSIISFPSYFFCKYKDEKNIYITDRMEGAFDKNFVFNSITKNLPQLKQNINSLNSKSNINVNKKIVKNENNKNKNDNNNFINNLKKENYFDCNNNKRGIPSTQRKVKNNNNNNNNNDFVNKKILFNNKNEIKENNNIVKNNNTNINKNNNIIKKHNTNINKNNKIKNNNDININNKAIKKNNNRNNNLVNNYIEEQKIKENINQNIPKNNNGIRYEGQNMGDFFLGDSTELLNLFGGEKNNSINNINNDFINQNQNNMSNNSSANKNENILADSIYQLTDAQVLQKREREMKLLEKQQEEKEKKEEEEKRKQIEEEKRIEKIQKDYEIEAEFAKMILSKEPDENNPDVCQIVFRSPDGEKQIERRFLKTDKIASLYNYVKSIGRDIFTEPDSKDFDILCLGFPPKNLEDKKNNTLEQEGLFPNSILQIREK